MKKIKSPQKTALTSKIRSATAEIRVLLVEIDDITEKTATLPKLVQELEATKAQSTARSGVHKEILAQRGALGELTPQVAAARVRSETISRVADRLSDWSQKLGSLIENKPALVRSCIRYLA